jgi:YVTN family beta-propeller protein
VRLTRTACSTLLLAASMIAGYVAPAEARDPVAFFAAQPYEGASSLDLSTHALSTTYIGQDVGDFAFSPDGRTAYVAFGGGIKAINVETRAVEGETIGYEGWVKYLVVTPDGTKAFAAEEKSQRVFVVELGGRHEDKQIWLDEVGGIEGLAITPDGRTVFVMDSRLHGVIPVDVATDAAGPPIAVASGEETLAGMAMSPDGRTLYVVRNPGTIVPVDVAGRSAGAPIRLAEWGITALAISSDGKTAYATGRAYNAPIQTPGVVPVDLGSGAAGATIPVGTGPSQQPNSIALTPDGQTAYVTSYESASVTPIDLATRTAEPAIAVANYPSAIAIDPLPAAPPPVLAPPPSTPAQPKRGRGTVHCVVPHLARISLPSIRKRLHRNHCRLAWVRYRPNRRRKGRLVSQSVRAGRRLPGNAKIGVVLSRGTTQQRP